jgi:hypothetical protein
MKGIEPEKDGLPAGHDAPPTVKVCTYCDRNNNDNTTHCLGCGTEFETPAESETPAAAESPVAPPDTTWRDHALQYVGTALLIFFLYVMSLGPVMRFSGKTTIVSPTMTKVAYPRWVGICYHPVFAMFGGKLYPNGQGGIADAYGRYIQWCQTTPLKPTPPSTR